MANTSVRFKAGGGREENYYDNLDSARGTSEFYEEINVGASEGVVSIQTRNEPQLGDNQEQEQPNDTKKENELFSVKRGTLITVVCALVVVFVAQIATSCFVGLYISKFLIDSPTNGSHRGDFEFKVYSQSTISPTDAGWSTWQTWSSCSSLCGTGFKMRSRDCTNPAPSDYGKSCSGQAIDIASCNSKPCLDAGWSSWQAWSSCSSSCGNGFKTRSRDCTNPAPSVYGKSCSGQAIDIRSCNSKPCLDISSSFTVTEPNSIVNDYLTFSKEIHNQGSDFSRTSGVFTCSQPGVYIFSFILVKKRASTRVDMVYCSLFKNSASIILGSVDPTDDDTDKGSAYAGNTAVIHLDRGDTVGLKRCANPSTHMESWTSFTGFLLNPDV